MTKITLTQKQLQEIIAKQVSEALAQAQMQASEQQPAENTHKPEEKVMNAWGAVMNDPVKSKQRDNYQYANEFPVSEGQMKFITDLYTRHRLDTSRSEERRVGKECRSRCSRSY